MNESLTFVLTSIEIIGVSDTKCSLLECVACIRLISSMQFWGRN